MLAIVKDVRFAFPGWPHEDFSVCFVENGGDSAPASYGTVAGNLVNFQTLDRHGDVVFGGVEGAGGVGVVVVKDTPGIVLAQREGIGEGRLCRVGWCRVAAAGYRDWII